MNVFSNINADKLNYKKITFFRISSSLSDFYLIFLIDVRRYNLSNFKQIGSGNSLFLMDDDI